MAIISLIRVLLDQAILSSRPMAKNDYRAVEGTGYGLDWNKNKKSCRWRRVEEAIVGEEEFGWWFAMTNVTVGHEQMGGTRRGQLVEVALKVATWD